MVLPLQKCVSPFLRAPPPVFMLFLILDKSCGHQIFMGKIAGPNSDAGKPIFLCFQKT
jgi:hypothetical protein